MQISEDGSRTWRRIEAFPDVPKWTYVSDVPASPRDVNTIFVTLNNWQRGDYKPYLVKSSDRGRTWTNISGDLPARHDVWSIVQDHVNPDLLFVGTEFGLFFTPNGGQQWVKLQGGIPSAQVRDVVIQERESDIAMATFGRGFYILDDYSALREITAQTLAEEARLFPLRHAYSFTPGGLAPAGAAGVGSLSGNCTTPNPPMGVRSSHTLVVVALLARRPSGVEAVVGDALGRRRHAGCWARIPQERGASATATAGDARPLYPYNVDNQQLAHSLPEECGAHEACSRARPNNDVATNAERSCRGFPGCTAVAPN